MALGPRDCAEDRLRVVVPGVVFADGGAGGGTEGGAQGGIGDEALEGGAEGSGRMRVKKEAVDAVGDDLRDGLGARGDGGAGAGHGFEKFDRRAVFVAVRDDADVHGGEGHLAGNLQPVIGLDLGIGQAGIGGDFGDVVLGAHLGDGDGAALPGPGADFLAAAGHVRGQGGSGCTAHLLARLGQLVLGDLVIVPGALLEDEGQIERAHQGDQPQQGKQQTLVRREPGDLRVQR